MSDSTPGENTGSIWGRTLRLVGDNLNGFLPAGQRLDARYCESAHRQRLEDARLRVLNEAPEGSPMHVEYQKPIDETSFLPCRRLEAAMRDLLNALFGRRDGRSNTPMIALLSEQEAEDALLLTWLLVDHDAEKRLPQICEFQRLPWEPISKGNWQCRALLVEYIADERWREVIPAALEKVRCVDDIDELADLRVLAYELLRYLSEHGLNGSDGFAVTPSMAILAGQHPVWHAITKVERHYLPKGWLPLPAITHWKKLLRASRKAPPDIDGIEEGATELHTWAEKRIDQLVKIAQGQERPISASDGGDVGGDDVEGSEVRLPKKPSMKAFGCWRLSLAGWTQSDIAKEIYGEKSKQYQVSRSIRAVGGYFSACGLPVNQRDCPNSPIQVVDPNVIDLGEREDHRTRRQRGRRAEDEDYEN